MGSPRGAVKALPRLVRARPGSASGVPLACDSSPPSAIFWAPGRDAVKILDASQSRSIDQRATREYGIPGIVLMENAGLQVVDYLESEFDDLGQRRILVLCGKGNNGGDGMVVARHLRNRGYDLRVLLFGRRSDAKDEPLVNLNILEKSG